jgi:hypothetical protein
VRKFVPVAFAVLAALSLACGAGSKDTKGPGAQNTAAGAAKAKHTVKLEVSGPASADITYGIGADTSQQNGAKLPWSKELTSSDSVVLPSIVAQSQGDGDITCRITVDGKVTKENKSTGQFAIVTCSV